jgi:hypothetical protein
VLDRGLVGALDHAAVGPEVDQVLLVQAALEQTARRDPDRLAVARQRADVASRSREMTVAIQLFHDLHDLLARLPVGQHLRSPCAVGRG